METIIVSVLSTLGAVALVTAIVVAFIKLTNKVDVNNFDREIENIYNEVNNKVEELNRDMYNHVNKIYSSTNEEHDDIRRFIDSRCDKLDTKIKDLTITNTSSKQLLND
jgi:site-specific DNA-adenine methylase